MRLQKYINELTNPTVTQSAKIINNRLGEVGRLLRKNKWKITDDNLIKMLNGVFKKDGMMFSMDKRNARAVAGFVTRAFVWPNPYMPILFKIKKGSGSFFKRYARPDKVENFFKLEFNKFFRDLHNVLSHELIHVTQDIVSRSKSSKDAEDGEDIYGSEETAEEYFSNPQEIEAFAQDTVIQLMTLGKSTVMNQYQEHFTTKDKVYRRYLKKVYQYMQAI